MLRKRRFRLSWISRDFAPIVMHIQRYESTTFSARQTGSAEPYAWSFNFNLLFFSSRNLRKSPGLRGVPTLPRRRIPRVPCPRSPDQCKSVRENTTRGATFLLPRHAHCLPA